MAAHTLGVNQRLDTDVTSDSMFSGASIMEHSTEYTDTSGWVSTPSQGDITSDEDIADLKRRYRFESANEAHASALIETPLTKAAAGA